MCFFASVAVWSTPLTWVLLVVHLLAAAFALGAVTHHGWLVLRAGTPQALRARYAKWMAIGYPLALLTGVLIYPSYNVLVRKPPIGVLEKDARWAVGLFEIKEHLATLALAMLPWLVLSARRQGQLTHLERSNYVLATCVFTILVYYVFITGGLVTAVRSF
ncbi:MAG: hypothetical protein ACYC35_30275 [Pirellulales bacterium]